MLRLGPYIGLSTAKIELAERWAARYESAGVFFSRLLPVIRHLIGIPVGILRMDFRWYAAATLAGSLLWCSVLAWLGRTIGRHPELLAGSDPALKPAAFLLPSIVLFFATRSFGSYLVMLIPAAIAAAATTRRPAGAASWRHWNA